ncbi:MAG: aminomethyl-transferring glycine dehydrogenase subunit GcvPA [Candidatus Omnitrophica bacterium]|nr:aminomethyl-transferring glycine dehydrogenase subunit GcvPA [Candidatus Omnitrophota bacterium]
MQYLSNAESDKAEMLKAIGVSSFDRLTASVPPGLKRFDWKIPQGISELELMRQMVELGRQNRHFHHFASYLGAGNYDHFIPGVVGQLAGRGEFLTAYTPYQGEASQGTLQSIYEYQSLVCELTAMDYSNASMYDGASSLAEAALLALRSSGRKKILLPATLHPEYRRVVQTYLSCLDAETVTVPMKEGVIDEAALGRLLDAGTAAVVVQHPNFFGLFEETRRVSSMAREAGALVIACVNPISLGILEPPGEYGADIAVGEGQPLGNPASFGGPHFGFFTVKAEFLRRIPGRIAGMALDKVGRRSFVLTLQAREQHIRREKATSNICTNHSLCALKGAIYLSLLGKKGIRKLALLNLKNAHDTHERLLQIPGVREFSKKPFFNEFALKVDRDPATLRKKLRENRILGPLALKEFYPEFPSAYLFAVTENRTPEDLARLAGALESS